MATRRPPPPDTDTAAPRPRAAAARVQALAGVSPVVVVTGLRQVGKSTLLATPPLSAGRRRIDFDQPAERAAFMADVDAVLRSGTPLTLDEVQREPGVMLALKRAVDAMGTRRRRGQFLVSGSANLLLLRQVADSLAGRATYLTLRPLTRRERLGLGSTGRWSALLATDPGDWPALLEHDAAPAADWRDTVLHGGFPEVALHLAPAARADWFDGYVATWLDRDLRDLAVIQDLVDFRRVMQSAASRIGQLANQSAIASDVGRSQVAVRGWLAVLETAYFIARIPAYVPSRAARVAKTPKLFWGDAALGLHMAGQREPTGAHFENVVALDLLAWRDLAPGRPEILHWRSRSQAEVDFVIEHEGAVLPIEVKTSRTVDARDVRGIEAFLATYPKRARAGVLLYDGAETRQFGRVVAVPWWRVL